MIQRCTNPNATGAEHWHARGITVYEPWRDFSVFAIWVVTNLGEPKPGQVLDRIDVDGPYCPENVRFATWKESARNTRRNRYITVDGETRCVAEWAEINDMNPDTIYSRLHAGWDEVEAVTTPVLGRGERRAA